jgi:hypothetical protein
MGRQQVGGRRAVCLRLTPLEDRTLPTSGVAATLSGGVLGIVDYKASDTLIIRQTPTGVTVTATDTNLTFTSVTRVTADVQNADVVTNDVSGLNGAAARAVYLSRRDPTGTKFASSGNLAPGATSPTTTTTTPPPNTTPPPTSTKDWFDYALNDAGIRSLARTVSGDGTIDRLDMLALFAQAEKDGTITANEIHDFKALEHPDWTAGGATPKHTPIFSMPDSVRVLTGDVIDGDPANATYQGAALGNLQAGAAAAQLQKLAYKWFMGLDHPTSAGTYRQVSGSLFVNGPSIADVKQGNLSDCYFLAALGALALDKPSAITSMFTDNRDGTFTVRFYNAGVAKYVTVDRMLPTDASGNLIYDGAGASATNSGNELWVALAEKAYAQINQSGWLDRPAGTSYSSIEEGYSDDALMQVTGGKAGWTAIVASSSAQLQAAVSAAKPTILDSRPSPGNGVVADHTYPVVAYNPTTQLFTLSNPQGGSIQLNWTQITQSFSGIWQLT